MSEMDDSKKCMEILSEFNKETKVEVNLSKCTKCQGIKQRILIGKQPDGKNKIYVNEHGKKWNGRCCADCVILKMKDRMAKLRSDRKEVADV
jgi:hypothetical protein